MTESKDDWLMLDELLELLKDQQGGRGLRPFSKDFGVTFQYLGKVLGRVQSPGPQICEVLGYEAITVYRPIVKESKR
jgi:hypothetical protein